MVSAHRRASAFGTFTAGYGIFWFIGSTAIGILHDISLPTVIAFRMITQFVAVLIFIGSAGAADAQPKPALQSSEIPSSKEIKTLALNKRSRVITEGDARAANRAMLYPVGFTASDFGKPIVGVPHGYSTMLPCNAGILSLVERAVEELKAAGAMPQTWGFPTGSDGISMGTVGMRYSLDRPMHPDRMG